MKINQSESVSTIFGTAFGVKTLFAIVATVLMGGAVIYTGIELSKQSKTATIQSRAAENSCVPATATFYVGAATTNTPTPRASRTPTPRLSRTPTPRASRTPTPSSRACDRNKQRWVTQLRELITTAGDVKTAQGRPYFDPKSPNGKYFLVNIPYGYSVAFLACYDCDHYDEDGKRGWTISWKGGTITNFVAKTPNNEWRTWAQYNQYIRGSSTQVVKFDGGGDSAGGNICLNVP